MRGRTHPRTRSRIATTPPTPAPTPTVPASPGSVRRTWPGVAPAIRSSPNSLLRRAITKAKVDAVTNTET